MNISAKAMHEFAMELKRVIEEFEEEMEILSKKELLEEMKKSEEDRRKGRVVTFKSLDEMRKELGL